MLVMGKEEQIKIMKNVDINTVDPESLVDIKNVQIDEQKPVEERIRQLIQIIHNPYCFLVNGIIVKVEYEDTEVSFEQRFERLVANN